MTEITGLPTIEELQRMAAQVGMKFVPHDRAERHDQLISILESAANHKTRAELEGDIADLRAALSEANEKTTLHQSDAKMAWGECAILLDAIKRIRMHASNGQSHGLSADFDCEDILHICDEFTAQNKDTTE